MYKVSRFFTVSLLLILTPAEKVIAVEDPVRVMEFMGTAVDTKTKQLLYIEKHQMQLDSRENYVRGTVEYLTPEGETFAIKTLDFANGAFAPDVVFSDTRISTNIEIDNRKRLTSLTVTSKGNPVLEKLIQLPDKAVIDAGFDRFIHEHWEEILKGKAIAFPFLAQTRGTLFDFEVIKASENSEQVVMEVRASNLFLRWLMDPIQLVYEKSRRRLMTYIGLTNIQKTDDGKLNGDFHIAEIRYEYTP